MLVQTTTISQLSGIRTSRAPSDPSLAMQFPSQTVVCDNVGCNFQNILEGIYLFYASLNINIFYCWQIFKLLAWIIEKDKCTNDEINVLGVRITHEDLHVLVCMLSCVCLCLSAHWSGCVLFKIKTFLMHLNGQWTYTTQICSRAPSDPNMFSA